MNTPKLGQLIEENEQRDAIHVAIAPVVAGEKLSPGDHIGFLPDGRAGEVKEPIGVVDPFLKKIVKPGERFFMLLYPGTITGLRHEWAHPAFTQAQKTDDEKTESEKWLRAYATQMNCYDEPEEAYQRLLKGLRNKEIFAHGSDLHRLYDLDDAEDLRMHAERVLGIPINFNDESFSFSCSC